MSDVKRSRKKALKVIKSDLKKLGCELNEMSILPAESSGHRLFSRLFSPGFGDTEEILCISCVVYECQVEILIPIAKWGFTPPYLIVTQLPETIHGQAEFKRGSLRNHWNMEPEDKARIAELKKTMPKVSMKEKRTSNKVPIQCVYKVNVGHSLEPNEMGGTCWTVNTTYEGGLLSGGHRPMVGKYLEAIPAIRKMLQQWNA